MVNSAEGMKIVLERLRNGGVKGVLEGIRHDRMEFGLGMGDVPAVPEESVMAGLADTVAELVARARDLSSAPLGVVLTPIRSFGRNPGALRMWLHRPADLPVEAPLVVVLHGCGQSAGGYAAGAGWVELPAPAAFRALNSSG